MSVQLDMFDPLDRLAAYWDDANRRWFGGEMKPVPIVGGLENTKLTMGRWSPFDRRIEIRQSLLDRIDEPGMYRDVTDVLLHEMIHQYVGQAENFAYFGEPAHGPEFTAQCNRIGSALGLPLVVERKPRGRDIPLSRHWPHSVRPDSKPMIRPKPDLVLVHLRDMIQFSPGEYSIDERLMASVMEVSQVTVHRKLCVLERHGVVFRRNGLFYRAAASTEGIRP